MKSEYDIIVVGGGPAGAMAASVAAENGVSVLLLEKRPEIGAPKRCGEGLSLSGIESSGLKPDPEWCRQEILGAVVYAPNGKGVEAHYGKTMGYVIERKAFDKKLAIIAAEKGAEVQSGARVVGILKDKSAVVGVKVNTRNGTSDIKCKVLIAADGVESLVSRWAGINSAHNLADICSGAQFEMANISLKDPKMLEIYLGNEIAPGGYCLTPSTEIITKNTFKPISDIAIGEDVLTLNGWERVSATSVRNYNGKIVAIAPYTFNNVAKLTRDHLVYIWNKKDGFLWKKASELIKGRRGKHRDGDYLLFPIPKEKRISSIRVCDYVKNVIESGGKVYPIGRNQFGAKFKYKHGIPNDIVLTPELMEFFGYFVSEGSTNSNGVIISNTSKEILDRVKTIGEKIFGIKPSVWCPKNKRKLKCVQIQFASMILKKLFASLFGVGCHNKHFPQFFLGLDNKLKISFLIGLFRGDGNKEKKSTGIEHLNYTTTSKHLLYDLWSFLTTIGLIGAIGKIKQKNAYRLRIYGEQLIKLNKIFGNCKFGKIKNNRSFIKDGLVFMGIKNLKEEKYTGKVYDIQSGGSFCPGFIVHNCWIFPKGEKTANVGIGIRANKNANALALLQKFVNSNPGLKKGSVIEINGGGIPVGKPLETIVANGLMIVGDAAHQVNAIHGGGIHESIKAAKIAGTVAAKCVKSGDYSKSALIEYQNTWHSTHGKKLSKLVNLRKVLESMSDSDLNFLAEQLSGDDIINLTGAEKFTIFAKIFAKRPSMLKYIPTLLR